MSRYENNATAWFILLTKDGEVELLLYNFFKKSPYDELKKTLPKHELEYLSSSIDDSNISTSYSSDKYLLLIGEGRSDNVIYSGTLILDRLERAIVNIDYGSDESARSNQSISLEYEELFDGDELDIQQ